LTKTPAMLYVEKGRVITDVQLSQAMCESWLKFVAPVLANSTRVDGRISLDLLKAEAPLPTWQSGDVAGVLEIHTAQVRPGPLAENVLLIAEQVLAIIQRRPPPAEYVAPEDPFLHIESQSVEFRMMDGRVHHRGLEVSARGVIIRTSGSVGLDDQSLDLMAQVPILDDWVEGNRLLKSLKGKTIDIPIGGTLQKPVVDRKALRKFAARLVTDAAGRLLEDELRKGLEGILRPRR
jgi:translocation and assembly module TamB